MSDWGKGAENNDIGWGQGVVNNSIGWGSIYSTSESGDTVILPENNPFTNATLAYSLRDLGLGATNVVRVRRSSDNSEQNFTATEITDGTLTSFCGVGDGFVTKLYDQKNSNNAIQTTASLQPKIVNAGSLILNNSEPQILFDGIDDYLGITYSANSVMSILIKGRLFAPDENFEGIFEGNVSPFDFNLSRKGSTNTFRLGVGTTVEDAAVISAVPVDVTAFVLRGTNTQAWLNNDSKGNFTDTSATFTEFRIANTYFSQATNMYLETFILYDSDQTANRIDLQNEL